MSFDSLSTMTHTKGKVSIFPTPNLYNSLIIRSRSVGRYRGSVTYVPGKRTGGTIRRRVLTSYGFSVESLKFSINVGLVWISVVLQLPARRVWTSFSPKLKRPSIFSLIHLSGRPSDRTRSPLKFEVSSLP